MSVVLDSEGMAVTNSEGQWEIYGYDGVGTDIKCGDFKATAAPVKQSRLTW